jgi:hypothetical protein
MLDDIKELRTFVSIGGAKPIRSRPGHELGAQRR